jgi:hypothetical protein
MKSSANDSLQKKNYELFVLQVKQKHYEKNPKDFNNLKPPWKYFNNFGPLWWIEMWYQIDMSLPNICLVHFDFPCNVFGCLLSFECQKNSPIE